ncbi:hypothetical protein ANSO36C_66900 (plasmid) [Nostoc cf. commune SO-36]|uniref:N-acetyltransferase domain-containing protein n=1 Tax=Nostoc cf. commune SO-36 TaxID=449208 RepID=A0ABN6QCK5_NOSCO|nr:hypothetical protein [Nostoc commune]BDI20888.1 hypothetical protein ANSO36C_66900 [Nostoc cf. commune SO-36]
MRNLQINLLYTLKTVEEKDYKGEVEINYSLYRRWKLRNENQKSIAFAFTSIENVSGQTSLWVHELQVIFDQDKAKGLGSYLLRKILKNGEKLNLPVSLFADPGGAGGVWLNQEELTNWYAKYGFVREGGAMVKRPKLFE